MFKFIFRKQLTIFLLLGIIIISLVFSILLNQPLHEGMADETSALFGASINNPPSELVDDCIYILKSEKDSIEKLSDIRKKLDNKYKILGDIYRKNESSLLKELSSTLSIPPAKNSDGNCIDENCLEGDKRTKAISVLSNGDYSSMEKIEKIRLMAGTDKIISNVLNTYAEEWLRMVRDNLTKLKEKENDSLNVLINT